MCHAGLSHKTGKDGGSGSNLEHFMAEQLDRRGFLKQSSLALAAAGCVAANSSQPRKLPVVILAGPAHERGLIHGKTLKKQILELVKLWKVDLAERFQMDAAAFIQRFVKQTDYLPAIKKW